MTPGDLLKGTLSILIIKLLDVHGKMYGYQISKELKSISDGFLEIKEGSLYPALHRLELDNLIESETQKIGERTRKYYRLTQSGKKLKTEKYQLLEEFNQALQSIMSLQKG
ncbi:MAG: PadR family transcriptional regulator [Bacteroidetes bacterium]|nr:PadR family transcriptional regulator [Bacteroidota bacterium]